MTTTVGHQSVIKWLSNVFINNIGDGNKDSGNKSLSSNQAEIVVPNPVDYVGEGASEKIDCHLIPGSGWCEGVVKSDKMVETPEGEESKVRYYREVRGNYMSHFRSRFCRSKINKEKASEAISGVSSAIKVTDDVEDAEDTAAGKGKSGGGKKAEKIRTALKLVEELYSDHEFDFCEPCASVSRSGDFWDDFGEDKPSENSGEGCSYWINTKALALFYTDSLPFCEYEGASLADSVDHIRLGISTLLNNAMKKEDMTEWPQKDLADFEKNRENCNQILGKMLPAKSVDGLNDTLENVCTAASDIIDRKAHGREEAGRADISKWPAEKLNKFQEDVNGCYDAQMKQSILPVGEYGADIEMCRGAATILEKSAANMSEWPKEQSDEFDSLVRGCYSVVRNYTSAEDGVGSRADMWECLSVPSFHRSGNLNSLTFDIKNWSVDKIKNYQKKIDACYKELKSRHVEKMCKNAVMTAMTKSEDPATKTLSNKIANTLRANLGTVPWKEWVGIKNGPCRKILSDSKTWKAIKKGLYMVGTGTGISGVTIAIFLMRIRKIFTFVGVARWLWKEIGGARWLWRKITDLVKKIRGKGPDKPDGTNGPGGTNVVQPKAPPKDIPVPGGQLELDLGDGNRVPEDEDERIELRTRQPDGIRMISPEGILATVALRELFKKMAGSAPKVATTVAARTAPNVINIATKAAPRIATRTATGITTRAAAGVTARISTRAAGIAFGLLPSFYVDTITCGLMELDFEFCDEWRATQRRLMKKRDGIGDRRLNESDLIIIK